MGLFKEYKITTNEPRLKPIVEAWRLSASHHTFHAGIDDDDIDAVEYDLGVKFPEAFRSLYKITDGMELCHGGIVFSPMDDDKLCVRSYSRRLRSAKWTIPKEVVAFGGDGSDGTYALWLPEGTPRKPDCAIVEIGEGKGLALRATNLCAFLMSSIAYYLMVAEEGAFAKGLDQLRVPNELRLKGFHEYSEEAYARIVRWADPDMPDPLPDPYKNPTTIEEMRARFGA